MDKDMLQALSALLDEKLEPINGRLEKLEKGQERIEMKLDAVVEQTADLTEFKTEVLTRLEELKEVKEVTKVNCYDIARLKSVK